MQKLTVIICAVIIGMLVLTGYNTFNTAVHKKHRKPLPTVTCVTNDDGTVECNEVPYENKKEDK